ncbi:MAG: hypothetical protein KGJ90_04675 [Patescibacteria group bacterium]|nr:hypothetical protein [Patescibacteria group bacterium]
MIISFDLDGTYLAHPEVFDQLADMLQESGHEVGILTNRHENDRPEIGFDTDFEFFLGQDSDKMDVQERCMGKAETMMIEGIDLHYDDEADFFPDYVNVIKIV